MNIVLKKSSDSCLTFRYTCIVKVAFVRSKPFLEFPLYLHNIVFLFQENQPVVLDKHVFAEFKEWYMSANSGAVSGGESDSSKLSSFTTSNVSADKDVSSSINKTSVSDNTDVNSLEYVSIYTEWINLVNSYISLILYWGYIVFLLSIHPSVFSSICCCVVA